MAFCIDCNKQARQLYCYSSQPNWGMDRVMHMDCSKGYKEGGHVPSNSDRVNWTPTTLENRLGQPVLLIRVIQFVLEIANSIYWGYFSLRYVAVFIDCNFCKSHLCRQQFIYLICAKNVLWWRTVISIAWFEPWIGYSQKLHPSFPYRLFSRESKIYGWCLREGNICRGSCIWCLLWLGLSWTV